MLKLSFALLITLQLTLWVRVQFRLMDPRLAPARRKTYRFYGLCLEAVFLGYILTLLIWIIQHF